MGTKNPHHGITLICAFDRPDDGSALGFDVLN